MKKIILCLGAGFLLWSCASVEKQNSRVIQSSNTRSDQVCYKLVTPYEVAASLDKENSKDLRIDKGQLILNGATATVLLYSNSKQITLSGAPNAASGGYEPVCKNGQYFNVRASEEDGRIAFVSSTHIIGSSSKNNQACDVNIAMGSALFIKENCD